MNATRMNSDQRMREGLRLFCAGGAAGLDSKLLEEISASANRELRDRLPRFKKPAGRLVHVVLWSKPLKNDPIIRMRLGCESVSYRADQDDWENQQKMGWRKVTCRRCSRYVSDGGRG